MLESEVDELSKSKVETDIRLETIIVKADRFEQEAEQLRRLLQQSMEERKQMVQQYSSKFQQSEQQREDSEKRLESEKQGMYS